jgi:hypothetical protein
MPIRLVKDDDNTQEPNIPNFGGKKGNSGNGILGSLLPVVLSLFSKRPKLMIGLILVLGAIYLFKGVCNTSDIVSTVQSSLTKGAKLDPQQFDETEVFESLDDEVNLLPERVSLEAYCPPRLNQGKQGRVVPMMHLAAV